MEAKLEGTGATGELVCCNAGEEMRCFVADIGKAFSQGDGQTSTGLALRTKAKPGDRTVAGWLQRQENGSASRLQTLDPLLAGIQKALGTCSHEEWL